MVVAQIEMVEWKKAKQRRSKNGLRIATVSEKWIGVWGEEEGEKNNEKC